MFTGIVEEIGTVAHHDDRRLRIAADAVLVDAAIGDSIAVDGCCLTVVQLAADRGWWEAEVSAETRRRTALGSLGVGDAVNLERPVSPAGRLGGHLVQGHVDAVGELRHAPPDMEVAAPPSVVRYLVTKGSVAVDGVSLTVVDVLEDAFTVAVIPHTAAETTLGRKDVGAPVNLEVDVIAKYVERLLAPWDGAAADARAGSPGDDGADERGDPDDRGA